MHAAQISFFTDPEARRPVQLLHDWPSLVDVAECAERAGIRVSVIQACSYSEQLARSGVKYHFLPFGSGRAATACDGLCDLLRTLAPDVLHVHGLHFTHDVAQLAGAVPGVPILLQDHASRPPRLWQRKSWRRGWLAATGVAFCSRDQAQPFAAAGIFAPRTAVYEIPESTSRFVPGDRERARRSLGLSGDPLLLWVGHLDSNKDPLTVLDGVSRAARGLPGLRLYCCYGAAPLLASVRRRIADDPGLRGRVHLMGRVPHAQVETLMQAADLFVAGSHREGSGYSLIEALACGLPPIVTDIPSFRSLTGSGSVGALWPTGDAASFCRQLLSLVARPVPPLRAAAREHFERQLSFEAVGRKLASAYEDMLHRQAAAGA